MTYNLATLATSVLSVVARADLLTCMLLLHCLVLAVFADNTHTITAEKEQAAIAVVCTSDCHEHPTHLKVKSVFHESSGGLQNDDTRDNSPYRD